MVFETINCYPLEECATTNIASDDLFRFIRECGHDPSIQYLGGGVSYLGSLASALKL